MIICHFSLQNREIVPCKWCNVRKYNFDMIEKADPSQSGKFIYYCSLNCYNQANSPAQTTSSAGAQISAGGGLPVIQSVASLAPASSGPPPVTQLPPMPPSQPMATGPPQVVCLTLLITPQDKNGFLLNMAIHGIVFFYFSI